MSKTSLITTAIVLSGGAGLRLNGRDKGLEKFSGQALIEHVLGRICPQVQSTIICANRNIEQYQLLNSIVCQDLNNHDVDSEINKQSFQGPISGITSALKQQVVNSNATAVLISSCDTPNVPNDLKQRLEAGLNANLDFNVAVAHDGDRRQNLHCLIERAAWQSLIDFYDAGGRAMHRWFTHEGVLNVDFSDCPECFSNYNTPEHLDNKVHKKGLQNRPSNN